MNKIFKIIENTAQGIMINGGFFLIMEKISIKAIVTTLLSFVIMIVAILLQED